MEKEDPNGRFKPMNSRRTVLKQLGVTAGALSIGGVGLTSAKKKGKDKKHSKHDDKKKPKLHEFDPTDRDEIKRAVRESIEFDNPKRLRHQFKKLPERQRTVLMNKGYKAAEIEQTATPAVGDPRAAVTSYIKNYLNQTVATFTHHINWSYNSRQITRATHYKTVDLRMSLWRYRGLITDRLFTVNPKTRVSIMEGKFQLCMTAKLGCVQTKTPGSRITFHNSRRYQHTPV